MYGAGGPAINGTRRDSDSDVWPVELRLALRNPIARIAQPTRLWIPRLPVPTQALRWTWLLGSNFLGVPVLNRNQSIRYPTGDATAPRGTKSLLRRGGQAGGNKENGIHGAQNWR